MKALFTDDETLGKYRPEVGEIIEVDGMRLRAELWDKKELSSTGLHYCDLCDLNLFPLDTCFKIKCGLNSESGEFIYLKKV